MAETNNTLTRVWQYPENTSRYSFSQGNAQRLSNGNTLIGWGSAGWLTEVRPDGSIALDIDVVKNASYRGFRFPWAGLPAVPPRVAVRPEPNPSNLRLAMSWNGATGITGYEIYAGPFLDELVRVKTVPRTGFETSTILAALDDDTCVVKVRPVHKDNRLTLDSHAVHWPGKPECGTQQFLPAIRQ